MRLPCTLSGFMFHNANQTVVLKRHNVIRPRDTAGVWMSREEKCLARAPEGNQLAVKVMNNISTCNAALKSPNQRALILFCKS